MNTINLNADSDFWKNRSAKFFEESDLYLYYWGPPPPSWMLFSCDMIRWFYIFLIQNINPRYVLKQIPEINGFSSPEPKAQVSFSINLSVARRRCKLFTFSSPQNHLTNFKQSLNTGIIVWRGFNFIQMKDHALDIKTK